MGFLDKLNEMVRQWSGKPPAPERNGAPGEPFRLEVGAMSSIGTVRENNEDRVLVDRDAALFVVADGMGGQAAGERASQLAVDVVPRELALLPRDLDEPGEIRDAIRAAVLTANDMILHEGNADPDAQSMGTTIVLGLCRGRRMYFAHLGDSRAYRIRDGVIERVTTDHNLAQALFEAQSISREDLENHRYRHVLWKYLGSKEVGDGPDIVDLDLRPGDRILLSTDGLTGSLADETLRDEILREPNPQTCAERLVQMALDAGSRDNVTCIVVHVLPCRAVPG
jgi:protein phosphatase